MQDIKTLAVIIGAYIGVFLGGVDHLMIALICFVSADYITGVILAIVSHTLSSAVGFRGICKKIVIFIMVGIANIIDVNVLGDGAVCRSATILYYISNDGISILENIVKIGVPVPQKIRDVLIQIRGDDK